jgi:plastocyanin
MKRLIAVVLVVALAAVAGAVAIPAFGASKSVKVGDNFFSPKSVTVKRGTKVTWRWTGSAPHNVTVTSGPKKFHSKTQTKGTYRAIPHTKGTYRIVCTIHAGMTMTLKVR